MVFWPGVLDLSRSRPAKTAFYALTLFAVRSQPPVTLPPPLPSVRFCCVYVHLILPKLKLTDSVGKLSLPPDAPPGCTPEITTFSIFTSMYFTLSPPARQNSTTTLAMCLPVQQSSYSFGEALSKCFTIE